MSLSLPIHTLVLVSSLIRWLDGAVLAVPARAVLNEQPTWPSDDPWPCPEFQSGHGSDRTSPLTRVSRRLLALSGLLSANGGLPCPYRGL